MRQSAEWIGVGAVLGAVLPDGDSVSFGRRRGDVSVSVGSRAAPPGNVRLRRSAHLHRDSWGRASVRMATRRARLGLAIDVDRKNQSTLRRANSQRTK